MDIRDGAAQGGGVKLFDRHSLLGAILLLFGPAVTMAGPRDAFTNPANPIVQLFKGQRLDLWSLKPVQQPELPKLPKPLAAMASDHPVDLFINAQLEKAGLAPAAPANRRQLARRLYFDLTGLPPTPEQLQSFLEDTKPDAYESLVDHLLSTRAYAENWARFWLDVVRYSDSNGYDWDEFRPQAWRFRDYVIRSIQQDKPYTTFVSEQLAGDEMVPGPPENSAQQDALIATGYLRIGPYDNSAKLFNEEYKIKAAMLADLTETTASAFLGLTLSCCRCHDHKTEPLSQADHYRFRAFFANVRFADDLPLDLAAVQRDQHATNKQIETKIAPRRAELEKLKKQDDKESKAAKSALEKEIRDLEAKLKKPTTGLCATDEGTKSPDTHLLSGGDAALPKEVVPPGIPTLFDPNPADIAKPVKENSTGRRLHLANWINSTENPLTARVMVNRIWQRVFGQGLVTTPNDFGHSGTKPRHPELLDWLAAEFTAKNGSWKQMIRLLVTSHTYQQSAYPSAETIAAANTHDSGNTLLWRMNPRRLTAEMLRDAMLHVSGLAISSEGGPPIWPDLPPEVLQANPAFLDDNAEKTKGWYPSPPEKRPVRSIYLVQKRSVRLPFLETFDLPENFVSCGRRLTSTVAPQALTLLNSEFAKQCAEGFADRVRKIAAEDATEQINACYHIALLREPSEEERKTLAEFLTTRGLVETCRVVLNLSEFAYLD